MMSRRAQARIEDILQKNDRKIAHLLERVIHGYSRNRHCACCEVSKSIDRERRVLDAARRYFAGEISYEQTTAARQKIDDPAARAPGEGSENGEPAR